MYRWELYPQKRQPQRLWSLKRHCLHCVKYSDTYKKNRKVSAGAEKWLDVEMWENTSACIVTLKARGY